MTKNETQYLQLLDFYNQKAPKKCAHVVTLYATARVNTGKTMCEKVIPIFKMDNFPFNVPLKFNVIQRLDIISLEAQIMVVVAIPSLYSAN